MAIKSISLAVVYWEEKNTNWLPCIIKTSKVAADGQFLAGEIWRYYEVVLSSKDSSVEKKTMKEAMGKQRRVANKTACNLDCSLNVVFEKT